MFQQISITTCISLDTPKWTLCGVYTLLMDDLETEELFVNF